MSNTYSPVPLLIFSPPVSTIIARISLDTRPLYLPSLRRLHINLNTNAFWSRISLQIPLLGV